MVTKPKTYSSKRQCLKKNAHLTIEKLGAANAVCTAWQTKQMCQVLVAKSVFPVSTEATSC